MFEWLGDILGNNPENGRAWAIRRHGDLDWRSDEIVLLTPTDVLTVPVFAVQGWRGFSVSEAEQGHHRHVFETTNNSIPFFKLYIGGLGHHLAGLQ